MEIFLIPARVGIFMFDGIPLESSFPYLYFELACKKLCFPPGKGINRRNESTISELLGTISELGNNYCYFVLLTIFNQSFFNFFYFLY